MNKHTTIRAVARKTGHTYFEVQTILEAIVEAWSEELVAHRQIAIQDFLIIKVSEFKTHRRGRLRNHTPDTLMSTIAYRVDTRISETFKKKLLSQRK